MKAIAQTLVVLTYCFLAATGNAQTGSTPAGMLQPDKVKHFIAGTVISASTYSIVYRITGNKGRSMLIGFGAGVLAGIAKELYDMTGRGTPDVKDAIWTGIGAGVGTVSFRVTLRPKKHSANPTFTLR